jgi:hypothetical protein
VTAALSLGGITGRVGVELRTELRCRRRRLDRRADDNGTELDSEIGVFAVGKLPINPSFDIFGRVGVARIETSPGGDDDGLAYGAGAQWNLTVARRHPRRLDPSRL